MVNFQNIIPNVPQQQDQKSRNLRRYNDLLASFSYFTYEETHLLN